MINNSFFTIVIIHSRAGLIDSGGLPSQRLLLWTIQGSLLL